MPLPTTWPCTGRAGETHKRTRGAGCDDNTAERGFTLIEMVVAIAIGAVAFTALAGVLGASLQTLAGQKSRTRANEIATEGIEDLQRFDYDHVGLCAPPGGTAPSGLSDTVSLANCSSPAYE